MTVTEKMKEGLQRILSKKILVNCKPIKNKLGDDDVDGDDICIILFQP